MWEVTPRAGALCAAPAVNGCGSRRWELIAQQCMRTASVTSTVILTNIVLQVEWTGRASPREHLQTLKVRAICGPMARCTFGGLAAQLTHFCMVIQACIKACTNAQLSPGCNGILAVGQDGDTDLRGCKKVRALSSHNVHAILDLCTCSPEELESLDIRSILSHHAVPAGARGSYSCASPLVLVCSITGLKHDHDMGCCSQGRQCLSDAFFCMQTQFPAATATRTRRVWECRRGKAFARSRRVSHQNDCRGAAHRGRWLAAAATRGANNACSSFRVPVCSTVPRQLD